jgi:hypothetical protein
MRRERPPDYADRLPRLVPKQEADISHLSDEMADLLYPGRRPRPFCLGLTFEAFEGPDGERALAFARESPAYREERTEQGVVHHAAFEAGSASTLRSLFGLVGQRPGTEVSVGGRKLPYGHELWLPLFWIFVSAEA